MWFFYLYRNIFIWGRFFFYDSVKDLINAIVFWLVSFFFTFISRIWSFESILHFLHVPILYLKFLPPLVIPDPLLYLWVLIFYFLLTNFIHKPFCLSLLNGKLRFSISSSCQLCSLHCSYLFIKFSFWILNCLHYFIRMFICSFLNIIQVFIVIILEFIEVFVPFFWKFMIVLFNSVLWTSSRYWYCPMDAPWPHI